jgi:outer membrane protein assembly factor BamD
LLVALAAASLLALCSCENEPPKTALGYTENARRAYETALETFNSHNWIEAQTLMREVKRKYSYSKYARLAELRIADADYEQEKFAEAIRGYKDFVRTHPTDEEDVAYARSRVAEASYAEIPESFLMPAGEERDQASVVEAYKELKAYLADYPSSKQSAHIRDLVREVLGRLVHHELYVARFYLARENYDAAVARIEYALHNYTQPSSAASQDVVASPDLTGEALLLLGETYLRMHKWPDARLAFETIVREDGASAAAEAARRYLDYLRKRGVT